MKNFILFLAASIAFVTTKIAAQPKEISECTIVYNVSVKDSKVDAEFEKSLKETTKIVYIKGARSRTDLISPRFTQTTFTDLKSDTTIILREIGNAKYITYLSGRERDQQDARFEGMNIQSTGETKTILGYDCVKAVAKLKDGSVFNLYYAPSVKPATTDFEYQFRDIRGLLLEYETEIQDGKAKIRYTATQITLTPVPAVKFELPTSGYRVYQPQKKP